MNSIFVIKPYRALGMWVFDDESRGLVQEPFVGGADTLIDLATKDFVEPENGFAMLFSDQEFPGVTFRLEWVRAELSGNVYFCELLNQEGWLCPALLRYFVSPPKVIYAKVQPLA
ncbi:MAG: hypothetical protein KF812_13380 [Fimbriimonadaceae bacterium]|nr:hypothetical protein [Fimbriimonadaceae bacterium]